MVLFKNHKQSGLTLIEVVIAIAIVSFVSISVLSLQQTLLRTTSSASALLTNIRVLNNFIADTQKNLLELKGPPREKIDATTGARLTYVTQKLPAKGAFENIKDIIMMIFGVSWEGVTGRREEKLTLLRHQPNEEKKS